MSSPPTTIAIAPTTATGTQATGAVGRPVHVSVGPTAVLDGDLDDAVTFCTTAMRSGSGARVATANLDFLALARRDPVLRDDLAQSTLVVADGAPVVWLAKLRGASRVRRVAGVDLVAALLREASPDNPLRVVLYGSTPDVARLAASRMESEYPGVQVVAIVNPPFRELDEREEREERALLAEAAPHLVLVALGCPKQERCIAQYFDSAPSAVWIGVGGTFDFFAGTRRRAPRRLQSLGLEWAARLVQEPRRLWRRYLVRDIPALLALAPGALLTFGRRLVLDQR